jgi:hypothetical protein
MRRDSATAIAHKFPEIRRRRLALNYQPHGLLLRERETINYKLDYGRSAFGLTAMTLAPDAGIGPLLRLVQYGGRVEAWTEVGPRAA